MSGTEASPCTCELWIRIATDVVLWEGEEAGRVNPFFFDEQGTIPVKFCPYCGGEAPQSWPYADQRDGDPSHG